MTIPLIILLILAVFSLGFVISICLDEGEISPLVAWFLFWFLVFSIFCIGAQHVISGGWFFPDTQHGVNDVKQV